jgi:segregation and condensation protein B
MNEEIAQEEIPEPTESEIAETETNLEEAAEVVATVPLHEAEPSDAAAENVAEPEPVEAAAIAEELPVAAETLSGQVVEQASGEPIAEQEPDPAAPTVSEDEFPSELDLGDESIVPANGESESDLIHSVASEEAVVGENSTGEASVEAVADEPITATREELKPAIECLLFVADEPLPFKQLCKVLGDVSEEEVLWALGELAAEYDARSSGLEIREIAGGWRISTRPQNHEFIRKYLKSRPSARLSLPALETLAVIAYKQPITIPEILEIRGVSSSSAIKTLLEKRLIVTKGRKETVGKPMMYGTSKEFMIQFGLKDLNELPSIEDFEDLAQ